MHHNPALQVDLIYLTGPMPPWSPQQPAAGTRTAHLSWTQALILIDRVWGQAPPDERDVARFLGRLLADLGVPWARASAALAELAAVPAEPALGDGQPLPGMPVPPEPATVLGSEPAGFLAVAAQLAAGVEADHGQRAVPVHADSPEELADVRDQINASLSGADGPGPVRAWICRQASSGGQAKSQHGEEVGYEIRLSWYA